MQVCVFYVIFFYFVIIFIKLKVNTSAVICRFKAKKNELTKTFDNLAKSYKRKQQEREIAKGRK